MYRYRVTVESLTPDTLEKKIEFEVPNHDDIFAILQKSSARLGDVDPVALQSFTVGLKLFSEAVLSNREHPFFAQLKTPLGEMMKVIKGGGRPSDEAGGPHGEAHPHGAGRPPLGETPKSR